MFKIFDNIQQFIGKYQKDGEIDLIQFFSDELLSQDQVFQYFISKQTLDYYNYIVDDQQQNLFFSKHQLIDHLIGQMRSSSNTTQSFLTGQQARAKFQQNEQETINDALENKQQSLEQRSRTFMVQYDDFYEKVYVESFMPYFQYYIFNLQDQLKQGKLDEISQFGKVFQEFKNLFYGYEGDNKRLITNLINTVGSLDKAIQNLQMIRLQRGVDLNSYKGQLFKQGQTQNFFGSLNGQEITTIRNNDVLQNQNVFNLAIINQSAVEALNYQQQGLLKNYEKLKIQQENMNKLFQDNNNGRGGGSGGNRGGGGNDDDLNQKLSNYVLKTDLIREVERIQVNINELEKRLSEKLEEQQINLKNLINASADKFDKRITGLSTKVTGFGKQVDEGFNKQKVVDIFNEQQKETTKSIQKIREDLQKLQEQKDKILEKQKIQQEETDKLSRSFIEKQNAAKIEVEKQIELFQKQIADSNNQNTQKFQQFDDILKLKVDQSQIKPVLDQVEALNNMFNRDNLQNQKNIQDLKNLIDQYQTLNVRIDQEQRNNFITYLGEQVNKDTLIIQHADFFQHIVNNNFQTTFEDMRQFYQSKKRTDFSIHIYTQIKKFVEQKYIYFTNHHKQDQTTLTNIQSLYQQQQAIQGDILNKFNIIKDIQNQQDIFKTNVEDAVKQNIQRIEEYQQKTDQKFSNVQYQIDNVVVQIQKLQKILDIQLQDQNRQLQQIQNNIKDIIVQFQEQQNKIVQIQQDLSVTNDIVIFTNVIKNSSDTINSMFMQNVQIVYDILLSTYSSYRLSKDYVFRYSDAKILFKVNNKYIHIEGNDKQNQFLTQIIQKCYIGYKINPKNLQEYIKIFITLCLKKLFYITAKHGDGSPIVCYSDTQFIQLVFKMLVRINYFLSQQLLLIRFQAMYQKREQINDKQVLQYISGTNQLEEIQVLNDLSDRFQSNNVNLYKLWGQIYQILSNQSQFVENYMNNLQQQVMQFKMIKKQLFKMDPDIVQQRQQEQQITDDQSALSVYTYIQMTVQLLEQGDVSVLQSAEFIPTFEYSDIQIQLNSGLITIRNYFFSGYIRLQIVSEDFYQNIPSKTQISEIVEDKLNIFQQQIDEQQKNFYIKLAQDYLKFQRDMRFNIGKMVDQKIESGVKEVEQLANEELKKFQEIEDNRFVQQQHLENDIKELKELQQQLQKRVEDSDLSVYGDEEEQIREKLNNLEYTLEEASKISIRGYNEIYTKIIEQQTEIDKQKKVNEQFDKSINTQRVRVQQFEQDLQQIVIDKQQIIDNIEKINQEIVSILDVQNNIPSEMQTRIIDNIQSKIDVLKQNMQSALNNIQKDTSRQINLKGSAIITIDDSDDDDDVDNGGGGGNNGDDDDDDDDDGGIEVEKQQQLQLYYKQAQYRQKNKEQFIQISQSQDQKLDQVQQIVLKQILPPNQQQQQQQQNIKNQPSLVSLNDFKKQTFLRNFSRKNEQQGFDIQNRLKQRSDKLISSYVKKSINNYQQILQGVQNFIQINDHNDVSSDLLQIDVDNIIKGNHDVNQVVQHFQKFNSINQNLKESSFNYFLKPTKKFMNGDRSIQRQLLLEFDNFVNSHNVGKDQVQQFNHQNNQVLAIQNSVQQVF